MSDDSKSRYLSYKASPFTALMTVSLSLFMQWFIWYLYEKAGYGWGFNLLTPLILCMMYHFVQLDAGLHGNFSRRFCFIWAVIVPLLFSTALTLGIYLSHPHLSLFDPAEDYTGSPAEVVGTYAGRMIFTSVYLLIFAIIDIPILKKLDSKRTDSE